MQRIGKASGLFTLRCTNKVLSRLGAAATPGTGKPTTVLGDWYANLIPTSRGEIVFCMNERTRLTVILPQGGEQHPLAMFPARVYNLLRLIGVSEKSADAELREMQSLEIAKTQDRKLLGMMNQIALQLQFMAENAPPGVLKASAGELRIAGRPFGSMNYASPSELAREFLG